MAVGQQVQIVNRTVGSFPLHRAIRGNGGERSLGVVGRDDSTSSAGLSCRGNFRCTDTSSSRQSNGTRQNSTGDKNKHTLFKTEGHTGTFFMERIVTKNRVKE